MTSEQLAEEIFRKASESIDVLGPPVDGVVAEAGEQRRRRRRTVVASVAAGALVVGLATWAASLTSSGTPESSLNVTRAPNPVDLAWYAGGRLQLDEVTVDLPEVTSLVGVHGGAVYGDPSGAVAFVAGDDGALTVLGRKAATAPVVVSVENSWVAWVSPGDGTELVVYDLQADVELGRLGVSRDTRPIAVDQDRVFFTTHGVDYTWAPGGEPVVLERHGLLDVESATRVYAVAGQIEIVHAAYGVSARRPGVGAQLSPGGNFVLTRPPGSPDEDGPYRPLLYDARSGERLPAPLDPDELALDVAFGPNHTVSYLVTRTADLGPESDGGAPLVVLRTCDVATSDCHDVIPLARPGERPLLAH